MVFFEGIQDELVKAIGLAQESISIAMAWFTNRDIEGALLRAMNRGIAIKIIVLNDRINNKVVGIDWQNLIDQGVDFYYSGAENMVHHKFCIIDKSIVYTGSYNWTYYAEKRNWENIIKVIDLALVQSYIEEFERIIESHDKVESVAQFASSSEGMLGAKYFTNDMLGQAETLEGRGDSKAALLVYNEIQKHFPRHKVADEKRRISLAELNKEKMNYAPFEIGILFKNGYSCIIPFLSELPYTGTTRGSTVVDNQTSISVDVQMNRTSPYTICYFKLDNLFPVPGRTTKVDYSMTLNSHGVLSVQVTEIGGYSRSTMAEVDINKYV